MPNRTENAIPNPASASEIASAFSATVYLHAIKCNRVFEMTGDMPMTFECALSEGQNVKEEWRDKVMKRGREGEEVDAWEKEQGWE